MDPDQQKQVSRRVDTVSYALLAEINNFHAEQSAEMSKIFKLFLSKQIEFHQQVSKNINCLRDTLHFHCFLHAHRLYYYRFYISYKPRCSVSIESYLCVSTHIEVCLASYFDAVPTEF